MFGSMGFMVYNKTETKNKKKANKNPQSLKLWGVKTKL